MKPSGDNRSDSVRHETLLRVLFIAVFGGGVLAYMVVAALETPIEADNFINSHSTSPGGHTALVELLQDSGRVVERRSGAIELPDYHRYTGETLVMLEPGPEYVERYAVEFEEVFEAALVRRSSVILSLPKRRYRPADPQPKGADELVLWEDVESRDRVEYVFAKTGFDEWLEIKRVESGTIKWVNAKSEDAVGNNPPVRVDEPLQVFSELDILPDNVVVLARTGDGEPVVVRHQVPGMENGGVILVSDPDLLTNRYIDRPGAGTFAMRIFDDTPEGALIINEDVHGFSTDASLEYLALTPPGLWVTLSAVLLLGLFGWRQATVLRPRYAEPQDRRARKYSIEGLARMMERARDHHTARMRLLRRSRLVLGARGAEVHVGGQETGEIPRTRIDYDDGATSEERFVETAQRIAHQVVTGETEHTNRGQA